MSILHLSDDLSTPTPAELWPSTDEIDGYTWELDAPAPFTAADAEFAAAEFGQDFDSVPDCDFDDDDFGPLDESRAVESAAMDAIERSLIPADLAHHINRTSLAGYPA